MKNKSSRYRTKLTKNINTSKTRINLWAPLPKRLIVLTKHASDRAIKYDLDSHTIKCIIEEGQRYQEGKIKARYALRTKHGTLVAICSECPTQITIITITKGR
jgi:hypothetical protein